MISTKYVQPVGNGSTQSTISYAFAARNQRMKKPAADSEIAIDNGNDLSLEGSVIPQTNGGCHGNPPATA